MPPFPIFDIRRLRIIARGSLQVSASWSNVSKSESHAASHSHTPQIESMFTLVLQVYYTTPVLLRRSSDGHTHICVTLCNSRVM